MPDNLVRKARAEDTEELTQSYVSSSPQVDQKTLDDYYAFFNGKEVDMLPYVYAEPSDAYNALVHAPEYYLFRDEVNTIAHNQDTLKEYLAGVTDIVEIGPGCDYTVENKTVPILNCAADLARYHAIDYSENYLKEACRSVSKRKSDIEVFGVEADLMNGKIDLGKIPNGKKGVLFLGSTLGNFTEAQQQHAISQVASMTNSGDIFILTVDANCDAEINLRAYANHYVYSFIVLILKYFAKIFPSFAEHIESFSIRARWNQSDNLITIEFITKKDVFFKYGFFGDMYIPKGKVLRASISRKFTSKKIFSLLKNQFDILETIDYSDKMITFICSRA